MPGRRLVRVASPPFALEVVVALIRGQDEQQRLLKEFTAGILK